MNKTSLIIMSGALVVAILVAMIVSAKMKPKPEEAVATSAPATEILVASKQLMTGDQLKPDMVRWQKWPEESVFNGTIRKGEQSDLSKLPIYEGPLRRNIEAGEPITTQSMIADAKGTYLSAMLGPGMRAASIAVGATTGSGGFIAPGDFVDIILTYTPHISGPAQEYVPKFAEKIASQLILSNVKVLAVDQEAKEDKREARVARTVTLEVSLEDAKKLAIAEQMGSLQIYLRKLGEKDDPNQPPSPLVTDVTTSEIIQRANTMSEKAAATQQTTAVRVYNGSEVQNVPVRTSVPDTQAPAGAAAPASR